jgi:anti-sigma-K factor RskA
VSERPAQTPDHEEIREDLAAYALTALQEDEAERLRAHLGTCDECRRQLRWLEEAVELLPRTVEQLEPPPRLRESIMDAVRAESPEAVLEPPRRGREPWWRGIGAVLLRPATAAALAATLIAGVAVGYLVGDSGGGETTTLEAQAMPDALQASGVLERTGSTGILRVRGMPTLARDQVYEVWVQRDGKLEPSSLFVPRSDRTADAAVPNDLNGADAVLVTKEPRGGSSQPTSAPLLSVKLQ